MRMDQTGFFQEIHLFALNVIPTTISDEPTITMSTVPIPVKEGSDATMQCSAEGNPPPTMMWLRLNYRLTDSPKHRVVTYADSETQRTHVLTVKETEMEDAGKYRCFVRNTVGQTEESVNIIGELFLHLH